MSSAYLSVLMVVYINDSPIYFDEALNSLVNQTRLADEVVLVENGPLTVLHLSVILRYKEKLRIKIVRLPKNLGLGKALSDGLGYCAGEFIARMDADDICLPNRFEKQMEKMISSDFDVIGGMITEFSVDGIVGNRNVHEFDKDIKKISRFVCPMNHVTVMFRKSSVLRAGNYPDFFGLEDYPLWAQMIMDGCSFYNLQEPLVNVRVDGFGSRRGGISYARVEYNVMCYFRKIGFISNLQFFILAPIKFLIRTLLKSKIELVYSGVRKVFFK